VTSAPIREVIRIHELTGPRGGTIKVHVLSCNHWITRRQAQKHVPCIACFLESEGTVEDDDLRDKIAEPLVRAFWLYNGYNVKSRHVSGCLIDVLEVVAPDIVAEIRNGDDMHDIYKKRWGDRE
jgi:hypothetical protein